MGSFAHLAGRAGIDEAWSRLTAEQATAAGMAFVVVYVSEDTTGKNAGRAEIEAYLAAGVQVLLVYEYSVTAAEGGAAKGARDAGVAIGQAHAAGYPAGCAIAFAIDEGSPNGQLLVAYARAFTAACHAAGFRSMVYGGYATVKACLDAGAVDLAWQTYAWSDGKWDGRAAVRQVQNDITINGHQVDRDLAMVDDIGAWGGDTVFDSQGFKDMIVSVAPPANGPHGGQPVSGGMRMGDILGWSVFALAGVSGAIGEIRATVAALRAGMDPAALATAIAAAIGKDSPTEAAVETAIRNVFAELGAAQAQVPAPAPAPGS